MENKENWTKADHKTTFTDTDIPPQAQMTHLLHSPSHGIKGGVGGEALLHVQNCRKASTPVRR